jgi:hypothetical protein
LLPFSMVMPMPSVVQYKRTTIRRTWPPADHNLPGLPSLSPEESICVEQARAALASVKRTFEFWVAIARGLATLRAKADAIGLRELTKAGQSPASVSEIGPEVALLLR